MQVDEDLPNCHRVGKGKYPDVVIECVEDMREGDSGFAQTIENFESFFTLISSIKKRQTLFNFT